MSKTVLVVDHEISVFQPIADVLSAMGHQVVWAVDGEDAFEKFVSTAPDMVLTAALLRKSSGFDLAKRIRGRADGKSVPLYLLADDRNAGIFRDKSLSKFGFNGRFAKPVNVQELARVVRGHLGEGDPSPSRRRPMPRPTAEETGDLNPEALLKLYNKLYRRRTTGKLLLASGEERVAVFVENGRPLEVRTKNIGHLTIGRILRDMGVVDPKAFARTLVEAKAKKILIGEALRKKGLVSAAELKRALRVQSERVFLHPFAWDSGRYEFSKAPLPKVPQCVVKASLPELLFKAVSVTFKTEDLWEKLSFVAPPRMTLKRRTPYDLKSLGLSPNEWRLVERLKKGLSMDQVRELSYVSPERMAPVLYLLVMLDLFEPPPEEWTPETPPEEPSAAPEESSALEDEVDSLLAPETAPASNDEDAEAAFEEGLAFLRRGDIRLAYAAFRRAVAINDRVPKYLVKLAQTFVKLPADVKEVAAVDPAAILKRAISLNEEDPEAHFALGMYFKETGSLARALLSFEKALELSPNHPDAAREARLMKIRLRKDSQYD